MQVSGVRAFMRRAFFHANFFAGLHATFFQARPLALRL
jgi:hypothetical protein